MLNDKELIIKLLELLLADKIYIDGLTYKGAYSLLKIIEEL